MAASRNLYIGDLEQNRARRTAESNRRKAAARAEFEAKIAKPEPPKPAEPVIDARARNVAGIEVALDNLIECMNRVRTAGKGHLKHEIRRLVRQYVEAPDTAVPLPEIVRDSTASNAGEQRVFQQEKYLV